MVCSLLVLDFERPFLELKQFREQHFWDNNFLNKREKLEFEREVKIVVFAHYFSWFAMVFVFTSLVTAPYFTQTIYSEEWSHSIQFVFAGSILIYLCEYKVLCETSKTMILLLESVEL